MYGSTGDRFEETSDQDFGVTVPLLGGDVEPVEQVGSVEHVGHVALVGQDPFPPDQSQDVKIDIPSTLHPSLEETVLLSFPDEAFKTFLSLLFLVFGFLITSTSLALTHERVPEVTPLPDIVLDNTTYHKWGLTISEVMIVISSMIAFSVVLFHAHRAIVFRRIFLLLGLLYMYRGLTMFVTVLPMSDPNYKCAPKLNHTITFLELMSRVATIISGGGLSMNGKQIYCGDFIFSGHTMALMMSFFVIREYSPRRYLVLHIFSLLLTIAGVVMLLISRGHYTIDVVVAYWITSRLWWTYHTLANNQGLKLRGGHNHMDNVWWWYIFRYFETNIYAPVPKSYSLPLPRSWRDRIADQWDRFRGWRRGEESQLLL